MYVQSRGDNSVGMTVLVYGIFLGAQGITYNPAVNRGHWINTKKATINWIIDGGKVLSRKLEQPGRNDVKNNV